MSRLRKLLACLKELGITPNIDNFQNRLVIQKTACLLELLEFRLGYGFSLYIRGPYSPDLTRDLYANQEIVHGLRSNYVLTKQEKKQLAKLSEISNNLSPSMLEIMSTYSFLVKGLDNDNKQAVINLKKLKPFYSEAQIAVGISKAKQLFFMHDEREIKKLKAEFAEWEGASVSDKSY